MRITQTPRNRFRMGQDAFLFLLFTILPAALIVLLMWAISSLAVWICRGGS